MRSRICRDVANFAVRALATTRRIAEWLARDPAYEAYLRHWQAHHAAPGKVPMSRAAFFRDRTRRKWSGVNRCC